MAVDRGWVWTRIDDDRILDRILCAGHDDSVQPRLAVTKPHPRGWSEETQPALPGQAMRITGAMPPGSVTPRSIMSKVDDLLASDMAWWQVFSRRLAALTDNASGQLAFWPVDDLVRRKSYLPCPRLHVTST